MLLNPLSTIFSTAQISTMKSKMLNYLLKSSNHNEHALTYLLLYGDKILTDSTNTFLLNYVIEYVTSTNVLTIRWFWNYKHSSL